MHTNYTIKWLHEPNNYSKTYRYRAFYNSFKSKIEKLNNFFFFLQPVMFKRKKNIYENNTHYDVEPNMALSTFQVHSNILFNNYTFYIFYKTNYNYDCKFTNKCGYFIGKNLHQLRLRAVIVFQSIFCGIHLSVEIAS